MGEQQGTSSNVSKKLKLEKNTITNCQNVKITQAGSIKGRRIEDLTYDRQVKQHLRDCDQPGSSDNESRPIKHDKRGPSGNIYTEINVSGNIFNNCNNVLIANEGSKQDKDLEHLMYSLPEKLNIKVVGRDQDVIEIYKKLKTDKCRRVVITGLGGIGKTTLAMYCATRWCNVGVSEPDVSDMADLSNQQKFHSVALLRCEKPELIKNSILGLAATLEISDKKPLMEIIKCVAKMYAGYNFLFILDNLDRCLDVKELLNVLEVRDNVFVLATSQNKEMKNLFKQHPISTLSKETTEQLFDSVLGNGCKISEENIHKLHQLLGGLPLAESHAASWIYNMYTYYEDREQTACDNYATEYIAMYKKMLNEPFPDEFQTINEQTAFITIKINIQKINSESKNILSCLCFLNPDEMYKSMLELIFSKSEVKTVIRDLTKYSLISVINEYYSVHRLTQEVARNLYQGEKDHLLPLYIAILSEGGYYYSHADYILQHISKDVLYSRVDNETMKSVIPVYREVLVNNSTSRQVIAVLRNAGCAVNVDKWSPLHVVVGTALRDDDMTRRVVCRLFDEHMNVNVTTVDGLAPLHVAVAVGYFGYKNVKYLLEKGADLEARAGCYQMTPLHIACMFYTSHGVESLIRAGANVHVTDTRGNTTLHTAARCNSYGVISHLVEAGVKVNCPNSVGDTLLHLLAAVPYHKNYTSKTIRELVKQGAEFTIKNKKGETPYNIAVKLGNTQTEKLLFPFNSMQERGETLLHVAVRLLDCNIILDLVSAGVEINCPNSAGDTPLHLGAAVPFHKFFTPWTLNALIKRGANVNAKNGQDETPYDIAIKHGNTQAAQLLGNTDIKKT